MCGCRLNSTPGGPNTMIHYHGGPITPNKAAREVWTRRHAFVSFARTDQLALAAEICQSFALDNGAFSVWKQGNTPDWEGYYALVEHWRRHPGFDFAVVPDVVDGSTLENDRLVEAWPFPKWAGAPVWHLHESVERLCWLAAEWPTVALGSSGEFSSVGSKAWWAKMQEAMCKLTEATDGQPPCKLHGLRMLNPTIFSHLPLSSADSTNVARNIGYDTRWDKGYLKGLTKPARAAVLVDRIEAHASAPRWSGRAEEERNKELLG
jgi:hypothetical protein